MYRAKRSWHGQQRDVLVAEAEGTPFVGMSLLSGNRLVIDVIDGGGVEIDSLKSS
jgi:hypothetical protein